MKLSGKDKRKFCVLVSLGFSPEEAARKIGCTDDPEQTAVDLLCCQSVQEKIKELGGIFSSSNTARAGLVRIAFGGISDAVRFIAEPEDISDDADLFAVSEIRKTDKGTEIKFFDRIKALEALAQMSDCESEDRALPFYRALENAAFRAEERDNG